MTQNPSKQLKQLKQLKLNLNLIGKEQFIRSFSFIKDKRKIEGTAQPYIVGMYVSIYDSNISSPIQLNIPHKKYSNWIRKFIKGLIKEKYKINTSISDYTNFISKEDLVTYSVLK